MTYHTILIVGGGNAGIAVAARLKLANKDLDVAIIEPSEKHYYQPGWTLVGGGSFPIQKTVRSQQSYIPIGVHWIKDKVVSFQPESNSLLTSSNTEISYDFLVVAAGIQLNWHLIKGLKETLGKNNVTSNYSFETAPYTFQCIRNFKAGQVAIFTSPSTVVKCAGAPQKIMYLAADYFRKHSMKEDAKIDFSTAGKKLFSIPKYADALQKVVDKYMIEVNYRHELIAVDGERKVATFRVTDETETTWEVKKKFDMLHVTPPQSAPDFISSSPLADTQGWVDVDKHTLQHKKFVNVFALGDAANTPNAKTGSAISKQAPVVAQNILLSIKGEHLKAVYDGYGSCPFIVGYGKLILAEFNYENIPKETFPFDQSKPRWTMWMLKKYFLPWYYWNRVLKGLS